MKTKIMFIAVMLSIASLASASTKIITLNDGSKIKGEVINFSNGRYTIKTDHLGEVVVQDEDVQSIQADNVPIEKPLLRHNVESLQGQILNDQEIMQSIEELSQDEEILSIIQNPELMNTIMTFDEEKIRNDASIQRLLQRDDIQKIISEIEDKVGEK